VGPPRRARIIARMLAKRVIPWMDFAGGRVVKLRDAGDEE
jgi:hypothetical protein